MMLEMAGLLAALWTADGDAIPSWDAPVGDDLPPWAQPLPALVVKNVNTLAEGTVRLYGPDGETEPVQKEEFERVADQWGEAHPLSRRLVQLVFKAAYHFGARAIVVISAHRPQKPFKGSRHATGEAIDFQLEGIKAQVLATHLRRYPRVGVGLYTHPKTQYVHLDVREESYHWLDGSPPGITWREQPIPVYSRDLRDAAYRPLLDLPPELPSDLP